MLWGAAFARNLAHDSELDRFHAINMMQIARLYLYDHRSRCLISV